MNRVIAVRYDRGMQALANHAENSHSPFAIVRSCVVLQCDGPPVNLRHAFERQAAFRDVPGVFDGVERQPHLIYRYSK